MTSILVTYASKHGSTAEIAEWIATELREFAGFTVDVEAAAAVTDVRPYDAVIIGGALYAGRWPGDARRFVRRNAHALDHLPVWAFSSGPLDRTAEDAPIPPTRAVTKIMNRIVVRDHVTFGGRLDPDVQGFIASRLAKEHGDDYRNQEQIKDWARTIAKDLTATAR
ncbi:flavodoxin domain-containing protein [Spirillospora sp. NPDC048911]|uniref:flavodoxin domain-containing protein n=1 Tax=Spirillospora sp. NPDC048911 TaxID=3364527 RepID=UPI003718B282